MENNNDWFENLNYPSTDPQQQTFVTKHDLELLHKKIIATDLIVQKYQEVNKALLRLQVENDDLKQQIDQITNECCIFSKQVTECTQECDNLKEQIENSNNVKRELHQQIRLLQDENMNNNHEIMVLRQFESLKDTNNELTKTVDRQQKLIGKLQLQLQRKSPIVFKPIRNKHEPSETDLALTKSDKSVRELRLALGRLVNFIQLSKIEIPTGLHIRPVLKAHDITDDFLEIEGDGPRKPVKNVSKPVVSQIEDDDDDDDDDHGDFIDVNHSIPVPPVHTIDVIEKLPLPSRQEQKKSRTPKKKARRKKDTPESTPAKLDELANELEIALSQSNQPISFLSDDDDDDNEIHKSDKQQVPQTISKDISFFTDDENEISPVIKEKTSTKKQTIHSLQVDSIIPMEVEASNQRTCYMSFLSEDDDENHKSVSSASTQESRSSIPKNFQPLYSSDKRSSTQQIKTVSKISQDSLLNRKDQTATTSSSISVDTLDSNRTQIVLRLLNVLTHVPVPLKPLRLVRRRIQQGSMPEEQIALSSNNRISFLKISSSTIATSEQPQYIEENNTILEEQTKFTEEIKDVFSDRVSEPMEETHDARENNMINIEQHEQLQPTAEEQAMIFSEVHEESQTCVEPSRDAVEYDAIVSEVRQVPQTTVEETSPNEQSTIVKESPVISIPQELTSTVEVMPSESTLLPSRPLPSLVLESSQQSLLKPFQISVITRLLNILTKLPVRPLILPLPLLLQKRKRKSVVTKQSVPLPRRSSRSPTRMQTRSLNSIRTRIARCNQPVIITKKRTMTESISPSPTSSNKRVKSTEIDEKTNDNDFILKYLNSSAKKMTNELKKILERKFHENMSLFIDDLYRLLTEFMIKKCNINHPLIEQLHPYEESITTLLTFIHNQSTIFQQQFLNKLNQTFEHDIQQSQISADQIKKSNRFFILTSSIFTSSSSVLIYTRLFDIGYSASHDILHDALSYIQNKFQSLISSEQQKQSSNILLHKILFEILEPKEYVVSHEYLGDLLITYQKSTHDRSDLLRSLILIYRHQSWSWCANVLCSKILFPLLERIKDQYHRSTFLAILQSSLSIYKDNEDFKRDINFHTQLKQRLQSLGTMNSDQCTVRDNIVSILCTYC